MEMCGHLVFIKQGKTNHICLVYQNNYSLKHSSTLNLAAVYHEFEKYACQLLLNAIVHISLSLDSQPQVIKFTSCLPMVGGSLWILWLLPPVKLVAMI